MYAGDEFYDDDVTSGPEQHGRDTLEITLYRDGLKDAVVEQVGIGCEDTIDRAISEARNAAADRSKHDPRWARWSATIDSAIEVTTPHRMGLVTVHSVTYDRPDHGERYYVGPDWQDGPEPW